MRAVLLSVVVLIASRVTAQEVVFTSHGAAPGTYYYAFDVAADGTFTVRQVQAVVIAGNPNPNPNPNPDPDPDPVNTRAKVKQWTLEVQDPTLSRTASGVAVVYQQVAASAENGDIDSIDQMQSLTTSLFNTTMRLVNKGEIWAGWKTKVDSVTPDTVQQGIVVWKEIAGGLEDAAGESVKVYLRPPNRFDKLREASCEMINDHGVF